MLQTNIVTFCRLGVVTYHTDSMRREFTETMNDFNNSLHNVATACERTIRVNDSMVDGLCTDFILKHTADISKGINGSLTNVSEMDMLKIWISVVDHKRKKDRRAMTGRLNSISANIAQLRKIVPETITSLYDTIEHLSGELQQCKTQDERQDRDLEDIKKWMQFLGTSNSVSYSYNNET